MALSNLSSPRYSRIGFDESPHMTEFRIRTFYRVWQYRRQPPPTHADGDEPKEGPATLYNQHLLLGNRCPHCETGGKEAGKIYTDATWMSDKVPLGVRAQYIFGKSDPKGLLPNYDKQLRMQGRAFSKQVLGGAGALSRDSISISAILAAAISTSLAKPRQ